MKNPYSIPIKIAVSELRSCYAKEGIIAGRHHFTDYWARDGFFAAFGALKIGDKDIVMKMINFFYKHQRTDGLIPYRIMRGPISLSKYLGHPVLYKTPKPTYHLRGFGKEVLDGTTLTVLFTALLGLDGWNKACDFYPKISKSLNYLQSREKDNLLVDGVMAEWNDTALKFGHLLYTNIIYWYMLDRLYLWSKETNPVLSKSVLLKRDGVAKALRKKLWNGYYFADWYDYKRQDYFYPFGNTLAIAWGLTDKIETKSILKKCDEVKIGFTLETNSPRYPWWRIDPFQQLIGMGDYQNRNLLWWQPILTYLKALEKVNKQDDMQKILSIITNKLKKDNAVYECFDRNGQPMSKLFFKSEQPFAWSSGMILWAMPISKKS